MNGTGSICASSGASERQPALRWPGAVCRLLAATVLALAAVQPAVAREPARGRVGARVRSSVVKPDAGRAPDDAAVAAMAPQVANTRHNLSAGGPGTIKAQGESEICIFCHTPHGSTKDAALWNRAASTAAYTPYDSVTMKARPGQPTGSSKLCLSCHDGTVAMGSLLSSKNPVKMVSGMTTLSAGRASNLGTDLSDDHPVSFTYDEALARKQGELRDPASLPAAVPLDKNKQVQCTTCHDPHNNRYGKFLVEDNTGSRLCARCHDLKDWQDAVHRTSGATWNGAPPDPWPHTTPSTVEGNACENCHRPHGAGSREQLLNYTSEEDNCFACHNGNVAAKDIQAEFRKFSVHPVTQTTGVHSPVEDAAHAPRHVECADCHDAHAATHAPASAPSASGALAGVRGVDAGGGTVEPVRFEYEVCFRCHGDGTGKGAAHVNRVVPQTNTRLEFDPSNVSFHPVEAPGHSARVPSLLLPLTVASRIYCTDCHNNDKGPGAGGGGPAGPHGSAFAPLLERRLVMTDFSSESADAYALCYKCHDRSAILGDTSFRLHRMHVVDQQTACTTCHDPHGASSPGLINFNADYVKAFNGQLAWTSLGQFEGTCTLTCHGKEHDQAATVQRTRSRLKAVRGASPAPATPRPVIRPRPGR